MTFSEVREQASLARTETGCAYASVLVNITSKALNEHIFTYTVPEEFQAALQVGQPVLVPFGAQEAVTGFITELHTEYGGHYKLKAITDILDETPLFNAAYFDFLRWVSDYYATPLTQVLECALPANLVQKTRKSVLAGPSATDPALIMRANHPKAHALVEFLKSSTPQKGGYSPKFLASRFRLPLRGMNQLLARLKSLDLVQVHTDLSRKTAAKTVKTVTLISEPEGLNSRQQEIIEALKANQGKATQAVLIETAKTTPATLKKLTELGILTIADEPVHRNPLVYYDQAAQKASFELSPAQKEAMNRVITGDNQEPYLLYGVTGSGKTEVYLSLTRHALEQGQSVLVMVPEIALTSQIAQRFINYFGADNIALWHSNLSDGERADTWRKLQSGELKILIGARSAVWVPMPNLGMILIDEEHDGSFKQDSPAPRYNAKTLALELAHRTGAKIVLGSATPELSTYYTARLQNRILQLPERFGGRSLADVHIVDMKKERAEGGGQNQLSRRMVEELAKNIEAGEQSLILLNRRGFYTTIQCTVCDYIFNCPNCDVALTFHRTHNRACCHYCGYETNQPQYCPICASMELNNSGVGTQRIEAEVVKRFPNARVLRLDSDVMQRKHAYREIFEAFKAGEADILIGTQMVAKGLDIENVTLVGVVCADSTFSLPDYKSAERGFQLLTQVAGRAGRGNKHGRVVVQAIQTQHPVLQYASQQDYAGFYEMEIQNREISNFPPYSQLFRFIVSSENDKRAQQYCQTAALHLRQVLKEQNLESQTTFMGPAPCVLPRIQGRYRYHFLIKNNAGMAGQQAITSFYKQAGTHDDLHFLLDIDAQSLL